MQDLTAGIRTAALAGAATRSPRARNTTNSKIK